MAVISLLLRSIDDRLENIYIYFLTIMENKRKGLRRLSN